MFLLHKQSIIVCPKDLSVQRFKSTQPLANSPHSASVYDPFGIPVYALAFLRYMRVKGLEPLPKLALTSYIENGNGKVNLGVLFPCVGKSQQSESPFLLKPKEELTQLDQQIYDALTKRPIILSDPIRCNVREFPINGTDQSKVIVYYSTKSPESAANTYLSVFGQSDFVTNYLLKLPRIQIQEQTKELSNFFDTFYSKLRTTVIRLFGTKSKARKPVPNKQYEKAVSTFVKSEKGNTIKKLFEELRSNLSTARKERCTRTIANLQNFFANNENIIRNYVLCNIFDKGYPHNDLQKKVASILAIADVLRCSTSLLHDNPYEILNSVYLFFFAKEQQQKSDPVYSQFVKELAEELRKFSDTYSFQYLSLLKSYSKNLSPDNAKVLLQKKLELFKIFLQVLNKIQAAQQQSFLTQDECISLLGIMMYLKATFLILMKFLLLQQNKSMLTLRKIRLYCLKSKRKEKQQKTRN